MVLSLSQENHLEEDMETHSSILACRIPWTEEPAGLHRVRKSCTQWLNMHACMKCCIGTWNVRSMNQSKFEVVKQEMARVDIDILGIRKLKWTRMGEFNSNDHYIYYYRQESLRRIIVNKRVWNAVLGCSLKNDTMISVHLQKSLKCSTWVQSQKWYNDLCSFLRQTI